MKDKVIKFEKNKSRKQLSDPCLGMSYEERLKLSGIDLDNSDIEIVDLGNGYANVINKSKR